jgi:uncharacterized membrane protein
MTRAMIEGPYAAELPRSAAAGTILNGHYAPPPSDEDGKRWVRTNALVLRSPEDLYGFWRDMERAPLRQEHIVEVRATGPKTSHWVMAAGSDRDRTVEWDSEILNDEPGKRIAWRSIAGDSNHAGEVIFEPAVGQRGTVVTVLHEFRMSKLAAAWETLTGRNPKQAVIENLRHFKALAESGEIPRTQGQPHGPRGTIGKAKKSLYGETIEIP